MKRSRRLARPTTALAVAVGAALSACSLYPDHPIDELTYCETLFSGSQVEEVDAQNFDEATLEACRSVDDWTSAASTYGDNARTEAEARLQLVLICERAEFRSEPICIELSM